MTLLPLTTGVCFVQPKELSYTSKEQRCSHHLQLAKLRKILEGKTGCVLESFGCGVWGYDLGCTLESKDSGWTW